MGVSISVSLLSRSTDSQVEQVGNQWIPNWRERMPHDTIDWQLFNLSSFIRLYHHTIKQANTSTCCSFIFQSSLTCSSYPPSCLTSTTHPHPPSYHQVLYMYTHRNVDHLFRRTRKHIIPTVAIPNPVIESILLKVESVFCWLILIQVKVLFIPVI